MDEYGNAIHERYTLAADVATAYLGGETIETDRGRYGFYLYLDELGAECTYFWARRTMDYGHRQFGTYDECKRYVSGESI